MPKDNLQRARLNAPKASEIPPESIDRENGIIYGVAMATIGEARGHGFELDSKSIDALVELGNQGKLGIKSRLGHPNESEDATGSFLGRNRTWRRNLIDGEEEPIARADIHFDPSARIAPGKGDLADYVMTRTESDPDSWGMSIVFAYELEKQKNSEGRETTEKLPIARPRKLMAADVVDEPAANDGMLSGNVLLSAGATQFLDKFTAHAEADDKALAFLDRFLLDKPDVEPKILSLARKILDSRGDRAMPDVTTLEELKSAHPALAIQLEQTAKAEGKLEGIAEERARCTALTRFAVMLEVPDAASDAIEKGMGQSDYAKHFEQARLAILSEPSAPPVAPARDGSATPLAPPKSNQPTTFLEAVDELMVKYQLSQTDATLRAEEKFPDLHADFLGQQKPGKTQIAH